MRLSLIIKTEAGLAAKTLEMAYQDMQQVRGSAAATTRDQMCAQRALTAAKAASDAWAGALFMEATDFMTASPACLDPAAKAKAVKAELLAETEAAAAEVLAANNRKRGV